MTAEGVNGVEIHQRLVNVYGASAFQISAVTKWRQLFRLGRDGPKPGRTADVVTPDMIEKVERVVLEGRRLKMKKISKMCGLSETSVLRVLHDHSHMSKVSAKWVPRNLSALQKAQRVKNKPAVLILCGEEPGDVI